MNAELCKDYAKWYRNEKTVLQFFEGKLTELGWDKNKKDEFIMDVGCGPGGPTKDLILQFFPDVEKIIAIDPLYEMIKIAWRENSDRQIEYHVADIQEWPTVQEWDCKISKLISIHCFQWVRNQELAFKNVFKLLQFEGQAAFFFVLEATFFDVIMDLQSNSKWSQYLEDQDNAIPESHHQKWDAKHYEEMVKETRFQVLHCRKEEKIDVYSTDEIFKNFFSSLCVLLPHIPAEHKEEFKDDLAREIINRNGRTDEGLPRHKSQVLELVVKVGFRK